MLVVKRLFPGASYKYTHSFFLNADARKTTGIFVILMHEINPLAYVTQHKNYFGTCNTNKSFQKLKSCSSLQNEMFGQTNVFICNVLHAYIAYEALLSL